MKVFTPNTVISSSDINSNFTELSSLYLSRIINRQNDTTNTSVSNQLIQTGWGYFAGNGTTRYMIESITFPVIFDDIPIVIACYAGSKAGDTTIESQTELNVSSSVSVIASSILDHGFSLYIHKSSLDGADPGVFSATDSYGYCWIAIGTKA